MPIEDALLPSLALTTGGEDAVATLRNDNVAVLPLRLTFHCPLVECTLWVTYGRTSLMCPTNGSIPPAVLHGSVAASCVGREDDAVVLTGAFAAGDAIELLVPLRALELYSQAGSGPHKLEFILACRPQAASQAHAAFRHVLVQSVEPFSHVYACLVSGGTFRHLVVRVSCNIAIASLHEMQLQLPREMFLVSSECSDLSAGPWPAGATLWFRYCIARCADDEASPSAVAAVAPADQPQHDVLIIDCWLDGPGIAPYRFQVDLRSDFRHLNVNDHLDLVVTLVSGSRKALCIPVSNPHAKLEAAFSAAQPPQNIDDDVIPGRLNGSVESPAVLSARALLDLRGNVFGSRDGKLVAR
jgi:hypothetical protein